MNENVKPVIRNELQMPRLEPQTGMIIVNPNPAQQVYSIYNLANAAPRIVQAINKPQVSTYPF